MEVKLKVGSKLTVPFLDGWTLSSSDPKIVAAGVKGGYAYAEAVAVGKATLTWSLAGDLRASLDITVMPA
jgi:hypothetical protein